jgi:lipopolysaccharide transport system permease protein
VGGPDAHGHDDALEADMTVFGFDRQDVRLALSLFRNSLRDRYMGSLLGLTWAVLNPLLLLGMYTFIFGFIYTARLPGSQTTLGYAIWLISGFVPYLSIAEALTGTAGSVFSSASLIKNIVFKNELLPIAATLVSVVTCAVGLGFLLLLMCVDGNYPTWHAVLVIPVVLLQLTFMAALGMFLGATTVFVRDIMQALTTLTMLIVFFTPIFYTITMLPGFMQKMTLANPFYHIVEGYRSALLAHQVPDWRGMAYLSGLSAVFFTLGLKYFRGLKPYFETVL